MHVLFDLDGTLTDSRTGIARCIRHALVELGVRCPHEDVLGAKAIGLRTVAALWGYGNQAELEAAQPDHLVRTSAELVACLRAARSQPTPPLA